MKETVRVAAVQMDISWMDPVANAEQICAHIRTASLEQGAEVVVFPELATSGYLVPRDVDFLRRYLAAAVPVPSAVTETIGRATREGGCYAVVGMLRSHPTIPGCMYNSAVVFGPDGAVLGVYDKTHIPSDEKHYFMPGQALGVVSTPVADLGVLICADNSFPEAARVLALEGAELLCVSYSRYAFPDPSLYFSLAQARAYENQLPVICANRVGEEQWGASEPLRFEGRSCIVGADGSMLAKLLDDRPATIVADITRRSVVDTRLWQTRFRDRRPELYGLIAER